MSNDQWIVFGTAGAIIVILALIVLGVAVQVGRRCTVEANRDGSNNLRQESDRARLEADEQAANADNADVKARRARVEPEKLEQEVTAGAWEAEQSSGLALDHHRQAIELDLAHGAEPNEQSPEHSISVDDQPR